MRQHDRLDAAVPDAETRADGVTKSRSCTRAGVVGPLANQLRRQHEVTTTALWCRIRHDVEGASNQPDAMQQQRVGERLPPVGLQALDRLREGVQARVDHESVWRRAK